MKTCFLSVGFVFALSLQAQAVTRPVIEVPKDTAATAFAPVTVCADFAGEWKGYCLIGGQYYFDTMKITQTKCTALSIDGVGLGLQILSNWSDTVDAGTLVAIYSGEWRMGAKATDFRYRNLTRAYGSGAVTEQNLTFSLEYAGNQLVYRVKSDTDNYRCDYLK